MAGKGFKCDAKGPGCQCRAPHGGKEGHYNAHYVLETILPTVRWTDLKGTRSEAGNLRTLF